MNGIITVRGLTKSFADGEKKVTALNGVDLTVYEGDIFGVIGLSGAGKSTFVRCLNRLEEPDEGSIIINGQDVRELSEKELNIARRNIGMIFQQFNLLSQASILDNVCFPMEIAHWKKAEARKRALELIELVGLAGRENAYPAQLSGGMKQRVAIARALTLSPKILLCDEATSALDPQTTQSILSLIRDIHDRLGITVIIITHQMSVVEQICTRVAILDGGEVAEEGTVSDVFSSPKSEAAKRLVYPEGYQNPVMSGEDGAVIRVVFNGANATETPLIAKMAMEENIAASILSASTRSIGDKAYGNMLLGISGGKEQTQRALDYLGSIPDIFVEEVKQ